MSDNISNNTPHIALYCTTNYTTVDALTCNVDTQCDLGNDHRILKINAIFSKIIHFANCFMQCRQNPDGASNPTIQHCIFFVKKPARFLTNLRASNKCRANTDAVMIEDVDDIHKLYQTGVMDELNITPSTTPAGTDAVSSITFENFNNKTMTFIQGKNTILFKITSRIIPVLSLQRSYFL